MTEAEALQRIREIAERAAREAASPRPDVGRETSDPAPTPSPAADRPAPPKPERLPPRHWSDTERDQELAAGAPLRLQLEAGDLAARETACARLRKLLADGQWHSALELVDVAGLRYGGRLHELRRGLDGGPPLDVESQARQQGRRQVWAYRAANARRA